MQAHQKALQVYSDKMEKTLTIYNVPGLGRMEIVANRQDLGSYSGFRGKIHGAYVGSVCYEDDLVAKSEVIQRGLELLGIKMEEIMEHPEKNHVSGDIGKGITFFNRLNEEIYRVRKGKEAQLKNKLRGAK